MSTVAVLPVRHAWRDAVTDHADPRIDAYALAVMNALHRHMDPDGVAWVGLRRLAEVARCTVNTVRARLEVLVDVGLLAVDRDGQARTIYRALLVDEAPLEPVEAVLAGPVDDAAPAAAAVSSGPAGVSPQRAHCVTGRHTYTRNPLNPAARASSSSRWGDPSAGRPAPGRPPVPVPPLAERDDGTLWVAVGAGR